MKKLSVIIVNYNVCYFLEQAIKSVIKASKHLDVEIFVVDNNSIDNSTSLVKEQFPEVILIENKENVGFSKANNQAIRLAKGEHVLLLNPDTVVEEDTLEKCCQFMDEHPEAGGLGVKMLDGKGNFLPESKRGLPTPMVAFYKVSGLASLFSKSKRFGKYHLGYLDEDETNEVEILAGAFMYLRKETLDKIGLLDEDYFMYGEDIDLSYRVIKGGYKNYYFPETRIIHYKGESTKKTSINYVFIFYRAMIIFAQKHFSQKNAALFSFLINLAVYFKASVDIVRNTVKSLSLPILDGSIVWVSMFFLANYWEHTYKPTAVEFPPFYLQAIIPAYIIIWLVSNYFSGGNDKPYKLVKILRGVLIGTIVISAVSNFTDEYRYSKALTILGGGLAFIGFTLSRTFLHFIKHKNFQFSSEKSKKVVIIGNQHESKRVASLLKQLNANVIIAGFISLDTTDKNNEYYLGEIHQLDEVIKLNGVNELIFCSKDIDTNHIIELMTNIENKLVDFKIVPNDSDFIIGSNSKNSQGDLYTIDIRLNIAQQNNIRNKRVFDIVFALTSLASLPISIWFMSNKAGFLSNITGVLSGKKSWVGFSQHKDLSLPSIKTGVLSPASALENTQDHKVAKQLDMLYAKDYTVYNDLIMVISSFTKLGN